MAQTASLIDLENCSKQPKDHCFEIYEDLTDGSVRNVKTNAYGQMEFVGPDRRTRAQYIRLRDETSMERLEEFMKTTMSLEKWPKMMISVIGSLNYFRIPSEVRERLQTDLLRVFQKVAKMKKETWFITYGVDSGVTKLIADAVEGFKYKDTSVLGIIPWNSVAKKELLQQSPTEFSITKYPIKKVSHHIQKQKLTIKREKEVFYLNKDHTHFFLVDTGSEKCHDREKNIKFRSQFNKFIVQKQMEAEKEQWEKKVHGGSFKSEDTLIPTVHFLINGGLHAFKELKSALLPEDDEPVVSVVVFEDSGRAANCISLACRMHDKKVAQDAKGEDNEKKSMTSMKENLFFINLLKEEIGKYFSEDATEIYNLVLRIVRERRDYITIYSSDDSLEDKVIWSIIERGSFNKNDVTLQQLRMAMLWERPDIAEIKLKEFMKGSGSKDLQEIMRTLLEKALIEQNVEFIDLIFKLGFEMSGVDGNMITRLYRKALERDKKSKRNMLDLFMKKGSTIDRVSNAVNNIASLNLLKYEDGRNGFTIDDPFKDLFLWAIMCDKVYTAIAVAKRGDNPLAKTLVARGMIIRMIKQYKKSPVFDDAVNNNFKKQKLFFEDRAIKLLENCSQANLTKTKELVSKPLPNWANKNIIQLAAVSKFRGFIRHQRCKDVVDDEWRGDIAKQKYLIVKVLVGIIFPFVVSGLISFKQKHFYQNGKCCSAIRGVWEKTRAFYTAPITKCFTYWAVYLAFIGTFFYGIVNKRSKHIEMAEHVLLVFILTFLIEEVKQMYSVQGMGPCLKMKLWWESHWNKLDIIAVLLFIIAYALNREMYNPAIPYARYFYAIDVILWVFKLLQLFSLNPKIGVYVVMMQRMFVDVFYFIIIIIVLVLAFALARFSILYPDNVLTDVETSMSYFTRIFLMVPFFQLFGEVFIGDPVISITKNDTVFGTPVVTPGRESEAFMMYLTYGYMLLGNLLLINLLIAVFNNTYTAVQAKSGAVWHFESYKLVHEYQKRSFLPPPFSIISIVSTVIHYVFRKLIPKKKDTNKYECLPLQDYFKRHSDLYQLLQFENECFFNYLQDLPKFENTLDTSPVSFTKEQRWFDFYATEISKKRDERIDKQSFLSSQITSSPKKR